ncbi:hypothetical protein ACHBTE_24200 [Streptomyces sp. M41]|uniref:hypothetical protein n=1 Tax=Streptomyces sp. M41 TaxID=3059412 RepID=UPI00374DF49D
MLHLSRRVIIEIIAIPILVGLAIWGITELVLWIRAEMTSPTEEEVAKSRGVTVGRTGAACPWEVRTVTTPPEDVGEPPSVPLGGDLEEELSEFLSYEKGGDANYTHLILSVNARREGGIWVKGVEIKTLKREDPPQAQDATVIGFKFSGCGGNGGTLKAYTVIDGRIQSVGVASDPRAGISFPRHVAQGDTLTLDITVGVKSCDCTWVPVVSWEFEGDTHETEYRYNGRPYRTISVHEYKRVAWEMTGRADSNAIEWKSIKFDNELLTPNP